jgi:hypothetical protein
MALNKWKFTKITGNPRNPGRRQGEKVPLFPAGQETLAATVLPELMRSTCQWAAGRIRILLFYRTAVCLMNIEGKVKKNFMLGRLLHDVQHNIGHSFQYKTYRL